MKKRLLGSISVSEVGMGCMALSHGYGQIPDEDYSIAAIRRAYDYGCTFFDTAEVYGPNLQHPGHNELIVGKAIAGFRREIVLATKLFVTPEELGGGVTLYDALRRHLEASMARLQTDYIDLYYLHRTNAGVPVEDVAASMGRLIGDGLIRGWGLSQVPGETLSRAHAVTPVSAVQNLYNVLERDCETDIFPFCIEHGVGVVPFSPVSSGLLSGKITVDTQFEKVDDVRNWVPQLRRENIIGNQPIIDLLAAFAARKGATVAQLSLAWMLHKYPNVVPIPGSKNQERIIENLGASQVNLTAGEFRDLEAALAACKIYGHRGHVEGARSSFSENIKKSR